MKWKQPLLWAVLLASAAVYLLLGYFTPRDNAMQVILLFGAAFTFYIFSYRQLKRHQLIETGFYAAILFRLLFLFAVPALSDDVYRFIWDGQLSYMGINPYAFTPEHFEGSFPTAIHRDIYPALNSQGYYSVYPPTLQLFFNLAAFFSGNVLGNIISLRIIVLIAELFSLVLLRALLRHFKKPESAMLLYGLNPLVIVELAGNLHTEVFMIFFVLLTIWFITQKVQISGLSFAAAIFTKLWPVLFIPFLLRQRNWWHTLAFMLTAGLTSSFLYLAFYSPDMLLHVQQSLDLYLRKFEFNGSFYYLIRWLGFQLKGYNVIGTIGPAMQGVALLLVAGLGVHWWYKQRPAVQMFPYMMLALTFYLLLATTVHPWYVTPLVAFSVFTNWRYAIWWSALIPLTYIAYNNGSFNENLWLIAVEYVVVFAAINFDLFVRPHNMLSLKHD